ncbi:hypothetical protein [Streptomyces sp. NBC_00161]|uniref:hypothetical protein n=1 Tax=Streptomyces sp. NBC_00161 TaxID=2975671 RepID=UPI0038652EF9
MAAVAGCRHPRARQAVRCAAIGGGDHTMFIAGDDADAKQTVTELLRSYGWTDILDLGGLVCARGMETVVACGRRHRGRCRDGGCAAVQLSRVVA